MKRTDMLWLLCGMIVIIGLFNTPEHDALSKEQALYCEMTGAFKNTNGQFGWPDYRGNARKVCGE